MTVGTYLLTDFNVDNAALIKAKIDANFKAAQRFSQMFACHETSTPNMVIQIDAGFIWNGSTLLEVNAQSTAAIVAPIGNPRIDRVVYDAITGAVTVVTGIPASSPATPAIPGGKLPACRVLIQTSSTVITNAMITDERIIAANNNQPVVPIAGAALTTLTSADIEKVILLVSGDASGDCDIVLPALSAVPIGGQFEFVSAVAHRQRIFAAAGDSMEGIVAGFYRVPSYEGCRIRKVTASLWWVTQRPARGVGETVEWAGNTGFLVAQAFGPGYIELTASGMTLNRVTYKNLFDVIGTTWGAGDGSTTFTLPPDPGRSTVGAGAGGGLTARTLGDTGGEEDHVLTIAELANHSHFINLTSGVESATHAHGVFSPDSAAANGLPGYFSTVQGAADSGAGFRGIGSTGVNSVSHTHNVSGSADATGSGDPHNTMHPFVVKRKLIKL